MTSLSSAQLTLWHVAELGVVVVGALVAAVLTRPPTHHQDKWRRRLSRGRDRGARDARRSTGPALAPVVYVETADRVEAWLSSPRDAPPPWVRGPSDHLWVRDDIAVWRGEVDRRVLVSLAVSKGRVHLDLWRCEAIVIKETTPPDVGVVDEILAMLHRRSDVRVIDRRSPEAPPHDCTSCDENEPAVTWLAVESGEPPDSTAAVVVGDGPYQFHAVEIEVGVRLRIPSVDLSLSLDTAPLPSERPVDHAVEDPVVRVRVLGNIDVEGAVLRPKQTALLVYLALHPGATAEEIEEAVWPECSGSARKRLHVTASQIRAAAGDAALPAAVGARYRTGTSVSTDLADFEALVDQPLTSAQERAANLAGALKLIRGPVCRYGDELESSYRWVDLEYWAATVEAGVSHAALELTDLSRQSDDLARAAWALRQGLLAAPLDGALVEALLDVLAESGDADGIRDAYDGYVSQLEVAQLGPPSETTVVAYRRATERCLAATNQ